ncbi:MAG: phosphatase PAP2 family protein [Nocardioides sp.]|uniref:phosphatase PAP2 family protein n=1 Tax=Nocardioides sp. TaxID=35761 RepID=UPI0039E417D1
MYRRAQLLLLVNAVGIGVAAVIVSIVTDRPLVDPDGSFLGPTWLRLPLLLGGAILLDILPRTLWLSRFRPSAMLPVAQARLRTHWNRERLTLVVVGILAFYIVYVSYRNLKSALPALISAQYDHELHLIDRAILFGHEPGVLMQDIFGTSVSAWVLSLVYIWFLSLVPICVTIWCVWSRNLAYGYWFVCSQALAWTLGTISYYALPTIGPGLQYPQIYATLAQTPTSDLMHSLVLARQSMLWDAQSTTAQTVAGFASLHCAITLLITLMVQYTLPWAWLKVVAWINLVLTVCATLYFGWHYISDDVAGIMIGLVSFYLGGLVSHQHFRRKGYARREALRMRPEQEVTTV